MLNLLYSKINNIVPIIGIQINNDNNYIIEYANSDNITNEQLSIVNDIIQSWPIDLAKILKIKDLDMWWKSQISRGFETSYGWKLGLAIEDVTLLTGAFLLAKEASNLGLSQDAMIMDIEGVSHIISLEDLTSLMLQYGYYRSQLSLQYSNKKIAIENSATMQEIEEIII